MKKTDNHNLKAKLDLRRHFLREFRRPLSVCDCYSGGEVIWGTLAKEFEVTGYLALDVKEKRGRLKLDSLRYLQNQEWRHNVVDLDAYGSPWRHFFEVIKRISIPTPAPVPEALVFLTIGETIWKQQQSDALDYCGIPRDVPAAIKGQLGQFILESCLAAPIGAGLVIARAAEARNPGGNARYIGMQIMQKIICKFAILLLLAAGCDNPKYGKLQGKAFIPAHTETGLVPQFNSDLEITGWERVDFWIPDAWFLNLEGTNSKGKVVVFSVGVSEATFNAYTNQGQLYPPGEQ